MLAACSSSKSGSGSVAGSLTVAQAQTVAKAGHLTIADLPGFRAKKGTNNQSDGTEALLAKCLGVKLPTYVFHDPGVDLLQGESLEIDSTVDAVAEQSAVTESVDAFRGPKASGCFEQQFRAVMQRAGATVSNLQVTQVPVHVSGTDVSFGLRLTGTFAAQGRQGRISAYQLGAGVGNAEVGVSLFDAGATLTAGAPSEAQLIALLQKSVNRVTAAYPR